MIVPLISRKRRANSITAELPQNKQRAAHRAADFPHAPHASAEGGSQARRRLPVQPGQVVKGAEYCLRAVITFQEQSPGLFCMIHIDNLRHNHNVRGAALRATHLNSKQKTPEVIFGGLLTPLLCIIWTLPPEQQQQLLQSYRP